MSTRESTLLTINTNTFQSSNWQNIVLENQVGKEPFSLCLCASNIAGTERNIIDSVDAIGNSLALPSSGTASSVASDNNADTHSIKIYYYTASTDTVLTISTVTLTGQTEVSFGNVFRISKVEVNTTESTKPAGKIWIGPNTATFTFGTPDVVYMVADLPTNAVIFSPIWYIPTNRKFVFDNVIFTSDINATGQVLSVKIYQYNTASFDWAFEREFFFDKGQQELQRSFTAIGSACTLRFTAERKNGAGGRMVSVIINGFFYDVTS